MKKFNFNLIKFIYKNNLETKIFFVNKNNFTI